MRIKIIKLLKRKIDYFLLRLCSLYGWECSNIIQRRLKEDNKVILRSGTYKVGKTITESRYVDKGGGINEESGICNTLPPRHFGGLLL